MIQLILVSHGQLGLALIEASQLLYGQAQGLYSLSLSPDQSTSTFQKNLQSIIQRTGSQTLIMTDLEGGTPCNQSLLGTMNQPDVLVLSGMNLPMLLEALNCRHEYALPELARHLLDVGKTNILISTLRFQEQLKDEGELDDFMN